MQSPENNVFISLVSKERQAKKEMTEHAWTGLAYSALGLSVFAMAAYERSLALNQEVIAVTEGAGFVGTFIGIGSLALAGVEAVRYLTISDKLQTQQANSFTALVSTPEAQDLIEHTEFIEWSERPDEPTEGSE